MCTGNLRIPLSMFPYMERLIDKSRFVQVSLKYEVPWSLSISDQMEVMDKGDPASWPYMQNCSLMIASQCFGNNDAPSA